MCIRNCDFSLKRLLGFTRFIGILDRRHKCVLGEDKEESGECWTVKVHERTEFILYKCGSSDRVTS